MIKSLQKFPQTLTTLALLLETGIPLAKAIRLTATNEKSLTQRKKLDALHEKISAGTPLLSTLTILLPKQVPLPKIQAPKLPNLPEFLRELATFFDTRNKTIAEVLTKCRYPFFLLLSTLILLIIFIQILLPQYQTLFASTGKSLPQAIQTLSYLKANPIPTLSVTTIITLTLILTFQKKLITSIYKGCPEDTLWLIAIYLEAGIPLNQLCNSNLIPKPIQESLYKTGKFTSSWSKTHPLTELNKALLETAENSKSFPKTLKIVAQNGKQAHQKKILKKLALIPPFFLIILGLIITLLFYLTSLPLLSASTTLI